MTGMTKPDVANSVERVENELEEAYNELEDTLELQGEVPDELNEFLDGKYSSMTTRLTGFRDNLTSAIHHMEEGHWPNEDKVEEAIKFAAWALEDAYLGSRAIWRNADVYLSDGVVETVDFHDLDEAPDKADHVALESSQEQKEDAFGTCVRLLDDVTDHYSSQGSGTTVDYLKASVRYGLEETKE